MGRLLKGSSEGGGIYGKINFLSFNNYIYKIYYIFVYKISYL
jgi:hypothetical protein